MHNMNKEDNSYYEGHYQFNFFRWELYDVFLADIDVNDHKKIYVPITRQQGSLPILSIL